MLETLHQFIFSYRWLVFIVALGGMAYALVLYYRAIMSLTAVSSAKTSQHDRRQRRRRPGQRGSGQRAGAANANSKAPTQPIIDADDDDDSRPDEHDEANAEIEAEIVDSGEAVSRPAAASGRSAAESMQQGDLFANLPDDHIGSAETIDHDRQATETQDEEDREPPTDTVYQRPASPYGIDQHARTRHDLSRPDAGSNSSYGVNEAVTTSVSRREHEVNITRNKDSARAPTEPILKPEERAAKTPANDAELLRRATRMEELGFHVGIVPEQMRQDPGQVSSAEKEDLLRTLGLLEQKAKEAHLLPEPETPESADSGSSVDLDDILARLDHALAEGFDASPSHNEAAEAATVSEPLDAAGQVEENQAEEDQTKADEADDESTTAPAPSAATSPSTTDDAPPDNEPDQQVASVAPEAPETPAETNSSQPPAAPPADPANDDPIESPPAIERPVKKNKRSAIPDWARADTFDEDIADHGDDDGKQLDLFNKPPE